MNKIVKRKLNGVVVSDKMDKTAVILVRHLKKDPKYQKRFWVNRRFKAHDEKNECKVGDRVIIEETRPLSKEKRWRILQKIESGK